MKNYNKNIVKITTVAVMVGCLSPSIQVAQDNDKIQVNFTLLQSAEAREGIHAKSKNKNVNRNVNRNINKNKNVNINVNKNVNVNVNRHGRYGSYRGIPILAFTTALVVGSIIAASTMPTTCTTVIANGISYRKCSSNYYQPFYEGDVLVYKVVVAPF